MRNSSLRQRFSCGPCSIPLSVRRSATRSNLQHEILTIFDGAASVPNRMRFSKVNISLIGRLLDRLAMSGDDGGNLAVLIDADNVSAKVITGLMAEVANYGAASVRRIYGDWTSSYMKSWRECLLEHSISPIQQFAYTTGKNATDGAMIIDAMDLLYTGRFSGFRLVSSDSDFTRLAARIREQGITVYGDSKTSKHAIFASN